MTLLNRLPYDLLRVTFDYLDVETLLNACLTGHALNEIASWALYTSITFNPDAMHGHFWSSDAGLARNPIEALERRPHLRDAVRNVILCTSENGYYAYPDLGKERRRRNAERCHKALVLLPNVTFLQVRHCKVQHERDLLSESIPKLRSLRILDFHGMGQQMGELPYSTATDIHAELSALNLAKTSMARKVRTLAADYEIETTPEELALELRAFSGLTRLSINIYYRLSPSEICQLVGAVPSLREGLFRCDIGGENGNIVPTGAKNLTYLRITFLSPKRGDQGGESGVLKLLVQCVAEQSRLRRLDLIAVSDKPTVLNGDPLLSHILPLHGRTLEKLKIPNLHISKAKLGQLLSQCDHLTALWLGVTPELKAHLPELLSKSTSLETLRVYAAGTWRFMYAQGLLLQTCPNLRVFKVCAKHKVQTKKASWKGRWKYDDVLQQPMILVDGPNSASFSAYTRRVQYVRNYAEYEEAEEGEEEATAEGDWGKGEEEATAGGDWGSFSGEPTSWVSF